MTWTNAREPQDPRPIRDLLGTVTKRLGMASPDALAVVFAGWRELVGDTIADHVRPLGLRDGVLHVEADEPGWATQLRYLGPDLVRRANERVGAELVKELAVRISRQPGSSRRRPPGSAGDPETGAS